MPCDHDWQPHEHHRSARWGGTKHMSEKQRSNAGSRLNVEKATSGPAGHVCAKCGAWSGELGSEPTVAMFVSHLVEVFREVRRVLRHDGTLWLNMGDSFAAGGNGTRDPEKWPKQSRNNNGDRMIHGKTGDKTLKPKDLCGVPWRLALALQDDGWYLRRDIIWAKENPMPESVTDRPATAHEYIFLLSKSARYFYDDVAVRQPYAESTLPQKGTNYNGNGLKLYDGTGAETPGDVKRRTIASMEKRGGANLRSVWSFTTECYPLAHFATFPRELPARCIRAGTSERGCCSKCLAPWVRVVETTYDNPGNRTTNGPRSLQNRAITAGFAQRLEKRQETVGWKPSCKCGCSENELVPCVVLDPFAGSGTSGEVAFGNGRDAILIELNPQYCDLIRERCGFALVGGAA